MKLFEIRTTAWRTDDFMLVTDLEYVDIIEVVMPIVNAERDGYEPYTNLTLMDALCKRYPSATIELYFEPIRITI
jgi:hypothetical protein